MKIEYVCGRHMPRIIQMEHELFEYPNSHTEYLQHMRKRSGNGKVVTNHASILGYMFYVNYRHQTEITSLAIADDCQRLGLGTILVDELQRRGRPLFLKVRESNLDAQLFFRARGFRCPTVIRDAYDEINEDAYLFRWNSPRERCRWELSQKSLKR